MADDIAAPEVAPDTVEMSEESREEAVHFALLEQKINELATRQLEIAEYISEGDRGAEVEFKVTEAEMDKAMEALFSKITSPGLEATLPIAEFVLADVVSDGTPPNDASGLTPDFYWAAGFQQSVRQWRPTFQAAGTGPWNDYGDVITSAKVTGTPTVGSGTAQKTEVTSTALTVVPVSFPNVWHSGAVDVSYSIIQQSNPNVRGVIRRAFSRDYARKTNQDAVAKFNAAANATGAALRTDSYVNLITDLRTTGVLIRGDNDPSSSDVMGNLVGVTSAQYTAILTLADADGRRIAATVNPTNADGSASLLSETINLGGFTIYEDPDLANAIQFNDITFMTHERAPEELSVVNVAKMGYDVGMIGGTTCSYHDQGIYKYAP